MTTPSPLKALLLNAAAAIRTLETEALDALHIRHDKDTHRAKLLAKCDVLMDLPLEAAALTAALTPAEKERVDAKLDNLAARAGQATSIGSVFYMGALLYPDDYTDGEPNELEKFCDTIA
ncbi:MAG: hypothetical protein AB7E47_04800 [Desulfovibrionaceae bacterium]